MVEFILGADNNAKNGELDVRATFKVQIKGKSEREA
jgi:hypothetical protein